MTLIRFSLNKSFVNKVAPEQIVRDSSWYNIKDPISPEDLIKKVVFEYGWAYSGIMKSEEPGQKKPSKEDMYGWQFFCIDIDNDFEEPIEGSRKKRKRVKTVKEGYRTYEQILNHPIVKEFAYAIYDTPSSTAEWNRIRIVFVLKDKVLFQEEYETMIQPIIKFFKADSNAKNFDRFFYGHKRCRFNIFRNILTEEQFEELKLMTLLPDEVVEKAETEHVKRKANYEKSSQGNAEITSEHVRELLSYIDPQPGYETWLGILSAVANTLPEHEAISLINEWSPDEQQGTEYKIKKRLVSWKFGTLVHFAERGGLDKKDFYRRLFNNSYNGYTNGKQSHSLSASEQQNIDNEKITRFKTTDLGNAERFCKKFQDKVLYEHSSKIWYIFDGMRFQQDQTGEIYRLGKEVVRNIYEELELIDNEESRKELLKWQMKSESKAALSNMITLAANGTAVASTYDRFDTNPYYLNLANGVFNMEKWTMIDHTPELIISKLIDIEYKEEAECHKWLKFLDEIFLGDQELIDFIQKAIGYSLSGLTSEQCLFFAYGKGANGKSIFFKALEMIAGEYYQKAPTEMLLQRHNDSIPNDIARLRGARLVVAAELPEDKQFNESKIKDLTGGDRITARYLHGEFFEFNPTHKLWIYGNHKPIIKGTDNGIWRRIKLIPFEYTVPKEMRRPEHEFEADFKEELPGMLKWALEGFYYWRAEGLLDPEKVRIATEAYRCDMDPLNEFLTEACETDIDNPNIAIQQKELYDAYIFWCEQSKTFPIKNKGFYKRLEEKGFLRVETGHGRQKELRGIKLTELFIDEYARSTNLKHNKNSMFNN